MLVPAKTPSKWRQKAILGLFLISITANAIAAAFDPSWLIVPAVLVGWYVADFDSGLVHMLMDYLPCPANKGLDDIYFYQGSRESSEYLTMQASRMASINVFHRVVYDFKNHHPRPDALGRRDLWKLIGSTVIAAALPFSLLLNLAAWLLPLKGWLTAGLTVWLVGGAFAQYFHGSLHRVENPWFIRLLRRCGLLMTPAAHQLHHDTLQRDFATNCGWSNPVINLMFRTLRRWGYLGDAGLEPSS